MTKEKIARLNALAQKSRSQGLTEQEKAEQAALRREYIDAVLGNLQSQLDHTYIVDEKGNRQKLKKKED